MGKLSVDNVTKVFPVPGSRAGDVHVVLKNLSLEIGDSEFVSLLGPSGCGKTTLLSMMGGFKMPEEGAIYLDDERITGPGADKSYVFQSYALFPWMNVKKNIMYGMKFTDITGTEREERYERLITMANLKEHENKFPIQLSGGMKQRVAVARALAGDPKLLLLDEPLGAIDFQMRELMQNELEAMIGESNITTVMVTHDVSESVYLSDRVIVLGHDRGNIMGDVKIDLPRPRDRESEAFDKYVMKLTSLVRKAFDHGRNI